MKENSLSWDGLYMIIEVGAYESHVHKGDSQQASKLELTVQYIVADIISIQHGVPHQIKLNPLEKVTLQFFNYYYRDLKFKVTAFS